MRRGEGRVESRGENPQAYKARVIYEMCLLWGPTVLFPATLAQPAAAAAARVIKPTTTTTAEQNSSNNYDNKEANIAPLPLLPPLLLPASGKKDPIFRYNPPPSAQK